MKPPMAPELLLRPKTRSVRRALFCSTPWLEAKDSPPQIPKDDICMAPEAQPEMLLQRDTNTRPEDRKAHLNTQLDDLCSERPEQQFRLGKDQKKTGSLPSSVDDGPEASDVQPEILLQPETRPVPHDQLVIEVKGVYAGLVMVKAKCIDIDEEHSAAAQEKGPSKRGTVKIDQHQSLIALHDQLLQRDTRPISHDQLITELKRIYAGLVMVEAKCIDIDEKQIIAAQEKDPSKRDQLDNDQYQSLIALHKQLLHEHHDFFLASQHPAASPALSRLAAKYSMPARMWRHGIHAFLEVLRHRLPESLEHMLAFIYIAYSMMALLYETVPAFEDTWIEYLGDLGRYRMAIEDDDPKDREVWSNVARFWYNKAAENSPRVGRLYHHLTILARPYSLEQLSLYTRALTYGTPFESARGSVMTLFNPITSDRYTTEHRPSSLEVVFIKARGNLFIGESAVTGWNDYLEDRVIAKASVKFNNEGVHTAVANIAANFEYGSSRNEMSRGPLQCVYENVPHQDFDGSEPLIATGTQDESSTKHQLTSTFPDVVRSALDRSSHWSTRSTSRGKTSRPIHWSFVSAAYKIRSSVALTLPICTLFIAPTTARTIPRNASNEEATGSFSAAVILLAHWPHLAIVIITLLVARHLATKDPMFVWGCMMSVWAFGWWTIRADSSTSLQISAV